MKQAEWHTTTPEETMLLGERIGRLLQAGMCITLQGDLGAGKTTFTKGIAKGMGICKTVNSPTFTIMKVYQGTLPLYHLDAYRLEGAHQDLGFEEYLEGDGVSVVEWPQFIAELIPAEHLAIVIENSGDEARIFHMQAHGSRYERILGEIV